VEWWQAAAVASTVLLLAYLPPHPDPTPTERLG
jgi:hypothetical protein